MKPIAEIADEYERNLVPLRQRRDALREQAKAEPCAELRCRLWHRVGVLDGMIYEGVSAIRPMRGDRRGKKTPAAVPASGLHDAGAQRLLRRTPPAGDGAAQRKEPVVPPLVQLAHLDG